SRRFYRRHTQLSDRRAVSRKGEDVAFLRSRKAPSRETYAPLRSAVGLYSQVCIRPADNKRDLLGTRSLRLYKIRSVNAGQLRGLGRSALRSGLYVCNGRRETSWRPQATANYPARRCGGSCDSVRHKPL